MKKHFLLSLLAILLLSSCSKSPSANFYLLPAPAPLAQGTNLSLLLVQKPQLPEYLQRAQMVLRTDNAPELKIEEYHRWAEDLASAFQRVLCNALDNELINNNIDAAPARIGVISPYKLNIYVNAFEGDLNKNASIDVAWSLDINNRTQFKGIYKESIETENSYADLVNVQAKLVENFAASIAQEIKANIK